MTLNILSFTITISKRELSLQKALHNQNVKKIFEENRSKTANIRIRQY